MEENVARKVVILEYIEGVGYSTIVFIAKDKNSLKFNRITTKEAKRRNQ
jgi:hypothetical protein